jgi:L-lactate dehydrogenase complex protein LldG
MTNARNTVLANIRRALRDVPPAEKPEDVAVARAYRAAGTVPSGELVERFAERVAEYKALVQRIPEAGLPDAIGAALSRRGARRVVAPADLPETWFGPEVELLRDRGQLSHRELDESDGVVSACAVGIAQTGTIVLDHGPRQGRRALTLLPDYHLCLIWSSQIVGGVPEAIRALEQTAREGRPLTFISGPSATSDIELNRVEGVHGPRTLEVLIVH